MMLTTIRIRIFWINKWKRIVLFIGEEPSTQSLGCISIKTLVEPKSNVYKDFKKLKISQIASKLQK